MDKTLNQSAKVAPQSARNLAAMAIAAYHMKGALLPVQLVCESEGTFRTFVKFENEPTNFLRTREALVADLNVLCCSQGCNLEKVQELSRRIVALDAVNFDERALTERSLDLIMLCRRVAGDFITGHAHLINQVALVLFDKGEMSAYELRSLIGKEQR